jgi:hypothetical protein
MTTRTYMSILVVLLVMCLDLVLQADRARANFVIPAFDVTQDGSSSDTNVTVDSAGAAHFVWRDAQAGLLTRRRAPDGTLGPVQTLAPGGSEPELAADGAGNLHFAWKESDGANVRIRTRRLGVDGTLGEMVDVSPSGYSAFGPQVAVDGHGGVVLAWGRSTVGGHIIQARRLAPDGTLGKIQTMSLAGDVDSPRVAVDKDGNAVVAWLRDDGSFWVAQLSTWGSDGSLGQIKNLTTTGANASGPEVAFDGQGTAHFAVRRGTAVFTTTMTPDGVVAPLKDVREQAGDTGFPPSMAVDEAGNAQITWAADALKGGKLIQTRHVYADGSWGPVQNLWFWPGIDPPAPEVALDGHGNAYNVWTADDVHRHVMGRVAVTGGGLGQIQQLSGTTLGYEGADAMEVALGGGPKGGPVAAWSHGKVGSAQIVVQGAAVPAPEPEAGGGSAGPGAGGEAGPSPDRVAPALSGLALKPAKLVARRRGRVTYTLGEPAKVVLRVVRRGTGRKLGSIRASGRAGRNSLSFRGRLRGRWLRPGRYVFVAVATDAAGNRSAARRARFRVVERAR